MKTLTKPLSYRQTKKCACGRWHNAAYEVCYRCTIARYKTGVKPIKK